MKDLYQVMPDLSEAEFSELKADISLNGVMVPVEYDEHSNVLDGHHRVKACKELGITSWPRLVRVGWTEDRKRAHARALNLARRHLSREQRQALIREQLSETPEKSDRQIAAALKVNHETVGAQRADMEGTGEIRQLTHTTGADGKTRPRAKAAKPKTVYVSAEIAEKAEALPEAKREAVLSGCVNLSDAVRDAKKTEVVEKLETVAARETVEPTGLFDVIVIDPPWPMQKIDRDVRPNQVAFDYPTMDEDELSALTIPADDDCHVWLWTTHKFLPMAFRLLDAWGLKYVCTFVWHKPGGFQPIGLPQYNAEFALYARKGSPKFIDTTALPTCFNAPRGAHSEKPEEFYEVLRRVTGGRRLDMFNRRAIAGFQGWGKEAV